MKTLIINSYAGSLTIAAQSLGLEVVGSYEDAGYGLEVQKANFTHLNYVAKLPWPTVDLSETMVIAHPPCAAFSQQNTSVAARGLAATKFQCTVRVLEHAFKNKCLALLVESVIPALEGGREVHERLAAEYGYDVYRVLENSITFGLPQWRPRFWAVFVRKGVVPSLKFRYSPHYVSLEELFVDLDPGEPDLKLEADYQAQLGRLPDARLLTGELGFGRLEALLQKAGYEGTGIELAKQYCVGGNFLTHCIRLLKPTGYATTLLFDSWWMLPGLLLRPNHYKAIMGFPPAYRFPGRSAGKFREYLSRGVCPPVATWLAGEVIKNLEGQYDGDRVIKPGETLDLLVGKGAWPK